MTILGPGFIMAHPPRTGTQAWRAWAIASEGLKWVPPRHTTLVPDGYQDADRILTVRDPYDRLVSAWAYHMRRKREVWHPEPRKDRQFPKFVEWLAEHRRDAGSVVGDAGEPKWAWTLSCIEFGEHFWSGSDRRVVFKLETIDEHAAWLAERCGFKFRRVARTNDTARRKGDVDKLMRGDTLRLVNENWAYSDCEAFDYPVR